MIKQLRIFFNFSLSNLFIRFIGFIVFPLLSKKFDFVTFGTFILSQTIFSYFQTISDMGIKKIGIRNLNSKKKIDDKDVSLYLSLRFLIGIALCVALFLLTLFLFDLETKKCLRCFAFSLVFISLDISWVFTAQQKIKQEMFFKVFERILYLLFVFVSLYYKSITLVCLSLCFSYLVASLTLILINKKRYNFFDFSLTKKKIAILKEGFVVGASQLLSPIFLSIDIMIINFYLTKESVAVYGAYEKIILAVISFGWIYSYSFYPEISSLWFNKKIKKLKMIYKKSILIFLIAFLICVPLMLFFDKKIIAALFSKEYVESISVFRCLVGMSFFAVVNALFFSSFNAMQKSKLRFKIVLMGISLNVILNFILVMYWGITGAAIATLVSQFLVFSCSMIAIKKILLEKEGESCEA